MENTTTGTHSSTPLPAGALAAVHRGDKVTAIKAVQAESNTGLLKSKSIVEAYIDSQPALKAAYDAADAKAKQAAMRWLMILVAFTILAFLMMGKG